MQYNTIQYNTTQYMEYNTVQYNTWNTIQYNTIQYYIITAHKSIAIIFEIIRIFL